MADFSPPNAPRFSPDELKRRAADLARAESAQNMIPFLRKSGTKIVLRNEDDHENTWSDDELNGVVTTAILQYVQKKTKSALE